MSTDTVLTNLAIGLNLAIDAGMVGFLMWAAFSFYKMKAVMLEADEAFLRTYPELKGKEGMGTNKLTLLILWVLILAFSIMSIAYAVSCSRLYLVLFRG